MPSTAGLVEELMRGVKAFAGRAKGDVKQWGKEVDATQVARHIGLGKDFIAGDNRSLPARFYDNYKESFFGEGVGAGANAVGVAGIAAMGYGAYEGASSISNGDIPMGAGAAVMGTALALSAPSTVASMFKGNAERIAARGITKELILSKGAVGTAEKATAPIAEKLTESVASSATENATSPAAHAARGRRIDKILEAQGVAVTEAIRASRQQSQESAFRVKNIYRDAVNNVDAWLNRRDQETMLESRAGDIIGHVLTTPSDMKLLSAPPVTPRGIASSELNPEPLILPSSGEGGTMLGGE